MHLHLRTTTTLQFHCLHHTTLFFCQAQQDLLSPLPVGSLHSTPLCESPPGLLGLPFFPAHPGEGWPLARHPPQGSPASPKASPEPSTSSAYYSLDRTAPDIAMHYHLCTTTLQLQCLHHTTLILSARPLGRDCPTLMRVAQGRFQGGEAQGETTPPTVPSVNPSACGLALLVLPIRQFL